MATGVVGMGWGWRQRPWGQSGRHVPACFSETIALRIANTDTGSVMAVV